MKKNILFYSLILFSLLVFGTNSVQIVLPPGQVFVGMNVQFSVQNPHPTIPYKWDFGDGTPEQTGSSIMHSFKEPKSYNIKCTFLKISGELLKDEKNFVVNDNRNIQIQGGPFIAGTEVNINTNNFVENNVKWDFGDGTPQQNAQKNTKHIFQNPGTYTVKAFDFGGNTTTAITSPVTIIADNRSLNITPSSALSRQLVSFTANNFTTSNLKWDFGDGSVQNGSANTTHSFQNAGNYTVKVFDSSKSPNTGVTNSIAVSPDNRAISFSIQSPFAGQDINFTASNFASNNLKWDFGNGIKNGGNAISNKYMSPGNFTVKVTDLSNSSFGEVKATITVQPENRSIRLNNNNPALYQPIGFIAENFNSSNIEWDFDDGIKMNGNMNVSHSYSKKGQFKVTAKEIGSNRPKIEKIILINNDIRQIEIMPSQINVGDFVDIKLKNSTVNVVNWKIGSETKNNAAKTLRYQFIDPGNFEILCNINGQTPINRRVTVNDSRRINMNMRYLFEGMDIKFETTNFKGSGLKWDYGDGIISNSGRSVVHKYGRAGNYTVKVYDFNGQSKVPVIKQIRVIPDNRKVSSMYKNFYAGAEAEFNAKGFVESSVKWNFGDGTVFVGNPKVKHIYKSPGHYTVKAVDMGGRGVKKIVKKVFVKKDMRGLQLPQKIVEGVPVSLGLKGQPTGNFEWKFDDGSSDNGNSLISKVFKRAGMIKVTLLDKLKNDPPFTKMIKISPDKRSLKLSANAVLPNKKLVITAQEFLGKQVKWDFGDGTSKVSSTQTVSHKYSKVGKYKLTATDFGGKGKKLFQQNVQVSYILPGFRIEAIEFAFNDGKYYKIAQKNQYKLDYNLKIKASGSGILNGKIIVDGLTLGLFEIYMDGSNIGYLKKSIKPKLPVLELGMHKLSFEFTNYKFAGKKPILRYFVTIGKRIYLKSPKDNSLQSLIKPVKFIWTTPYKDLNYEYAYSVIPFQFLNDNQIKWEKSKSKKSVLIDLKKISKSKFGYLIIRAKDNGGTVKTVSQIYSFRIK